MAASLAAAAAAARSRPPTPQLPWLLNWFIDNVIEKSPALTHALNRYAHGVVIMLGSQASAAAAQQTLHLNLQDMHSRRNSYDSCARCKSRHHPQLLLCNKQESNNGWRLLLHARWGACSGSTGSCALQPSAVALQCLNCKAGPPTCTTHVVSYSPRASVCRSTTTDAPDAPHAAALPASLPAPLPAFPTKNSRCNQSLSLTF